MFLDSVLQHADINMGVFSVSSMVSGLNYFNFTLTLKDHKTHAFRLVVSKTCTACHRRVADVVWISAWINIRMRKFQKLHLCLDRVVLPIVSHINCTPHLIIIFGLEYELGVQENMENIKL